MPIILAAATAEPDAGWGRLLALALAGGLFWAGVTIHKRWLSTRDDPSPSAEPRAIGAVKPQVSGDSDSGDSARVVAVRRSAALDEFVADEQGRRPTAQLVREARRRFRASESAVYRALRRARKGGVS